MTNAQNIRILFRTIGDLGECRVPVGVTRKLEYVRLILDDVYYIDVRYCKYVFIMR